MDYSLDFDLPSETVESITKSPRRFLIFSQYKVGKTSALLNLPNCLLLDLEDGSDTYSGLKLNVEEKRRNLEIATGTRVSKLKIFYSIIKKLADKKKEGFMYDYIALDTLTALEEMAKELALYNYRVSPEGKNFKGADIYTVSRGLGYVYVREAFSQLLAKLDGFYNKGLILTAHAAFTAIHKDGEDLNVNDVALTGKLKTLVCSKMDAIGYLKRNEKGDKNIISFKTDERNISIGSRIPYLANEEFVFSELDKKTGTVTFHWNKIYKEVA